MNVRVQSTGKVLQVQIKLVKMQRTQGRNQISIGDKDKKKNVKTEIRLSVKNSLETLGIIKLN